MQGLRGTRRAMREAAATLLRGLPEPSAGAARAARADAIEAVDALERRFGFPSTAPALPRWQAPGRVRQVGLWGARLASLAPCASPSALVEAAAFNLAVAMFDTIVDERRRKLLPLAAALRPELLERCIEQADPTVLGDLPDADLAIIVRLFGHALAGAGRRHRDDPAARAGLASLLRDMYESETGISKRPWLAKTLPVVWIGRLAGASEGSPEAAMFDALASFIARWDDAQDLRHDWLHGRYNVYLDRARTASSFDLIRIPRLPFGGRLAAEVADDLQQSLHAALNAASACGRGDAFLNFLFELVAGAA
jgi:hypothetical protein